MKAVLVAIAPSAAACGGSVATVSMPARGAAAPAPPAAVLPSFVVATNRTVLRSARGGPPVGVAWLTRGVPLRVLAQHGTEVTVGVAGAVEVEGVAALDTLGVMVCEPGPLDDRIYAGNRNVLTLRGGVEGGRVPVRGVVHVDVGDRRTKTIRFEAAIPVERLCAAPPPPRHAGTEADPIVGHGYGDVDDEDFPKGARPVDVPKDTPVTLYDRPDGAPIVSRAADEWGYELVELRREGDHRLVAAGDGPYVMGWMKASQAEERTPGPGGLLGVLGGGPRWPLSLATRALARLPLHELAAGTEIEMYGVRVARLTEAGYARVAPGERDGFVYVTAAVDEDVVVAGWVRRERVGAKLE